MLAHRDQENLLHGHQTAAASKPLNQGVKHLNPKTPGNKPQKTPFKIPLNDENNAGAFLTGKPGLKTTVKGGATNGGKSGLGANNNFVTPLGPKTRAPLGQKTTNAKARGLQTPGPILPDNDAGKSKQKSASARKARPRISHTEPVKIDVLAEVPSEEKDIEYMPPPVKDLPDIPDDVPFNLDLSIFANGGLTKNCLQHFYDRPEADGLSYNERQEMEAKVKSDKMDAILEARLDRDMDMLGASCTHVPECLGDRCKDEPARKRKLEQAYQNRVAEINKSFEPKSERGTLLTKGPSTTVSKTAARSLAMSKPSSRMHPAKPTAAPKPSRVPSSFISSKKNSVLPMKPDPKRHASAVRASNTTMGYSKGRAASNTLRKSILPPKDSVSASMAESDRDNLTPAAYMQKHGSPPVGSSTWTRFKSLGYLESEEMERLEDDWSKQLEDLVIKDAEQDFVLTL